MNIDIEEIRAWVRSLSLKEKRVIDDEIDYPFDSLSKFGYGVVADPGYERVQSLIAYKKQLQKAA